MLKARFLERENRFTALVELDGKQVKAHVANSGRLRELFRPGNEVYLIKRDGSHRATKYDLVLVRYEDQLVSVDARVPNKVVADAVAAGQLADFSQFTVARREVRYGNSRLDLLLEDERNNKCFVEVKSVTLVENGTAMFPDAPTLRGARHLEELAAAVGEGYHAAVIFLIQRDDALVFTPNDRTDPDFGQKLRAAAGKGVGVYAYRCRVTPELIVITEKVPVKLADI